ncbi:MAG: phosphoribosyl-AMP cyclohydrolase [Hyphomicrobiaceae bacterium]
MADKTSSRFTRSGSPKDIETSTVFQPLFDAVGLLPAIVEDAETGQVLMFAWMNEDALVKTLDSGQATFWSRSRKKLWTKGEESGNTLQVREIRTDCDQDVVLLTVSMGGGKVACHTGAKSCFYRQISHSSSDNAAYTLTSVR